MVARVSGRDWTQAPEIAWSVDGTPAATVLCDMLPVADAGRVDCETTFALDEVEPRSEIIRDAPDYVAFLYLNLNDWFEPPEQATLMLEWPSGVVDEHEIALGDERTVESGNECPVNCRTGSLEVDGAPGGE